MLYTNEEPLVQRTCIKTASLQSEEISAKGTSSKEGLSKNLSPNDLGSETIPPKEPEYKVPEELKLQTLICGHQVLTSLSDKSLVSVCHHSSYTIRIRRGTASSVKT